VPLTILLQAVAAGYLNLSQVSSAIIFASISNLVGFVIAGVLILRGLSDQARIYSRN
jgi:hypothetical protein